MPVTIYHNPRCSKSRQTLELLEEHGIEPEIIKYLKTPPDADTIKQLLCRLELNVRDIIRSNESIYKELDLSRDSLTDDELINAIVDNPKLLQRPIVDNGNKATIGRPPENALDLI